MRDFDPEKRAFFELGGVKSVLAVPVFADGQWLGVIGFDDCRSERNWAAAEIDTIKTVAELVGAAVARAAHLKTLDDANRIIENSPTILFRTAAQYPYPLTYVSQNIRQYGYQADQFLTDPLRWAPADRQRRPADSTRRHALDQRRRRRTRIMPNSACTGPTVRCGGSQAMVARCATAAAA